MKVRKIFDRNNKIEGDHQTIRIKGALVNYDILLFPDYSGCIGMETHSTLSSSVAPDYGKTSFQCQEEEVFTISKENNESNIHNIVGLV